MTKTRLHIGWFLGLVIFLSSCAKEFMNPYDPATPPDSWMPRDFVVDTLDNNSFRLSWQQDELHIDGYTVRRDISGEIREFILPFDSLRFTDLTVIDSTATDTCSEVAYSVMARAGDNLSSPVGNDAPLYLPLSAPAFAGTDITVTDTATSVTLSASEPQNGEHGEWTIVSGTGGTIASPNSPFTTFSGSSCETYILAWSITGACGTLTDQLTVSFQQQTTQANAGQDILAIPLTVSLSANIPAAGENGQWSVVSGTGGTFVNASLHNTTFFGLEGQTYTLQWQIFGPCSITTDFVNVATPSIGDTYQGGVVFYLDGNGGGLIASPSDQSSWAPWGCYGSVIGSTESVIGSGETNTTAIVANGCSSAGIAARICYDLTLGGYTDWFLPSEDELQLMHDNLHIQGLGEFAEHSPGLPPIYYWSSTEYSASYARMFQFQTGTASNLGKNSTYYVRAVRAF